MYKLTFSQPLGRLGADVLGIDPVADSIGTAEVHAWHDPDLRGNVRYRAITLEELSEKGGQGAGQFDAVLASEVVEHLADLETFTLCCNQVLKVGHVTRLTFHTLMTVLSERTAASLKYPWCSGVRDLYYRLYLFG